MTQISAAHLERAARRIPICVPHMSMTRLLLVACRHYNDRNPGKRPADPESISADPRFMARICVNYLRHATKYDSNRDSLHVLTDSPEVRAAVGDIIKGRTLGAIAIAYPQLADEASRQARRTDMLQKQARRPVRNQRG